MKWHIGRSFKGTAIEDKCPCPKEPCGLVDRDKAHPDCQQHPVAACRTMRQSHPADKCPGRPT